MKYRKQTITTNYNNNKELKKVITHIICPEQFQALPESAYNQLEITREQISKSRNIKEFE